MKKIRYSLASIALAVALGGSIILGIGSGSMVNTASSQVVSAASVAGKSTQAVAYRPLGWCPIPGIAC